MIRKSQDSLPRDLSVCFIGTARYDQPLNPTDQKKFRELSSLGRIFVIGFSNDMRWRAFLQHAHFYLFPRFPFALIRQITAFSIWPLLALWLIWRHRVSLLVCQSPYEGFIGAIAKRIAALVGRKVALIVENHGDFEGAPFLQRKVFCKGMYRWIMHRAARIALQQADTLRAVSEMTFQQLRVWSPRTPIIRFPAWTDIDTFLNATPCESSKANTTILFAGVLTPLKGVEHLIETFAMIASGFPRVCLVIVGREEDRLYANKLRTLASRHGLSERIMFVGEVSQRELAQYMCDASIFVLPSISEGLGRVIFEAMATGTSVIASRVGGIPEIIEEGKTGFLVPPADQAALAERMTWALNHPAVMTEMGLRAKEYARNLFSTKMYVEDYHRLFKQALRNSC